MSAAASIPYRLSRAMCHAVGCLDSCSAEPLCEAHWGMLNVPHQDALAQMLPNALRDAMSVIARKEGRHAKE